MCSLLYANNISVSLYKMQFYEPIFLNKEIPKKYNFTYIRVIRIFLIKKF